MKKATSLHRRLIFIDGKKKELVFFGQHAADDMLFADNAVPLKIDDLGKPEVTLGDADIRKVVKQVECFLIVDRSYILRILLPYLLTTSKHNDAVKAGKAYRFS